MLKRLCSSVLAGLLLHGSAHAQVMTTNPNLKSSTGYTACTGDKIQFTDFTVTPMNPAANQNVTVQFKIRNLCSTTLNVPYKIADGSTVKSSGTKGVSGKQVASVQYSFTVAPGTHAIDAYLDEANSLKESSSYRVNNGALDAVSFAVAPPPMQVLVLDALQAKQYGSVFSAQLDASAPCVTVKLTEWRIQKTASLQLVGPAPCGSAVFELFRNFTLKNGWTIKTIEVKRESLNVNSDWEWVTRPTEGTADPFARIRLKPDDIGPGIKAYVSVTVMIEGPAGTNPYH